MAGGLLRGGDVFPPAAVRVADELLRRYGLGRPLDVQPAGGGLLNQNLVAFTAGGAYFLKGYRYVEPEPVAREHRVIAFAADAGLPVAAPLAAPGGRTFLRVGGRQWAVFPRLTDRQLATPELSPANARAMGRVLGRIHTALARFPAPDAARYPAKLLWDSRTRRGRDARVRGGDRRLPGAGAFRPARPRQLRLPAHPARRRRAPAGPRSPTSRRRCCTGTTTRGISSSAPDGAVTSVIDWELASSGPRALEIVRTLDVALAATGDDPAAAQRRRAFLHAYAAEAPLTRDECLAMPELYWAYRVHSLWVYEEHYRKGSARTDHLALADIPALTWWLQHRHQLGLRLADELDAAPRGTILTARS